MDVLNSAYINTSSGVYSYSEAIQKAIEGMTAKGIHGATYKRKDGKAIHYSIEAAVRRDTLTAIHQLSNRSMFESLDVINANYIDVSSHLGARVNDMIAIANHAGWQGKQYQKEGESKEYPNFVKSTGFGDILGLSGVNCRHRFFVYFPGISVPYATQYDSEENRNYYYNSQKLRSMERNM